MLRLRGAALPRSSPSLLRAAAGDSHLYTLVLPAQSPGSVRRAAITVAAQRRWFGQKPRRAFSGKRNLSSKEDDKRELQASFERAHGLGDATSTADSDPGASSAGGDSVDAALRMVKKTSRTHGRPKGTSKKPGRGPKKGAPKKGGAKKTSAGESDPGASSSAGNDGVDALLGMLNNTSRAHASPRGSNKQPERAPKKGGPQGTSATTKKPAAKAGAKPAPRTGAATKPSPGKKASAKHTPGAKPKKPQSATPAKEPWEVNTVSAKSLDLQPLPHMPVPVPGLSYNLDRCLFKPGVYPMQDARTRVFNFDPYLSTIMPINEFDYTAIKGFVSSSNDPKLIAHAAKHKKKYSGSTSSMSSMLSHFHFLLSAWRPINAEQTSKGFVPDSMQFTRIMRAPAASFLRWRDGVYAVDADKQFDTANILSMLGKSLEKLLTLPKEEYEMYRRSKSDQLTDEQKNADESFHYTMIGDFILRSQLDAHDPRLPGEGMFDIKTRAVLAVRMDARGYEKGKSYEIRSKYGQFESFEREYFDMIRSAFLKYSLQVRMGRMDGIFVAYHNTERMFGFQYMPLEELDNALHGTTSTVLGDQEFKFSMHLLNKLFNRATEKFPNQPLRIHVEARPTDPPLLYFFAKPVTEEKIEQAQEIPKAEVQKFERELMGFAERQRVVEQEVEEGISEDAEEEAKEAKEAEGLSLSVAEMNQKAEEAVENDELGMEYVRRSIERALERSGLMEGKSPDEVQADVEVLLETLTNGSDAAAEEGSVVEEGSVSAEDLRAEDGVEGDKEQQAQETPSRESGVDKAEPPAEARDPTAEGLEKTFEGSTAEDIQETSEGSTTEPNTTEQQDSIEAAFEKSTTIESQEGIEAALDGSAAEVDTAEQQDGIKRTSEESTEEPDTAEQHDGTEESDLDELILRLMKRTGDRALVDETATDEETAKVTRFKQALSELLTESQKEQDGGEEEEAPSDTQQAAAAAQAAEAHAKEAKKEPPAFDKVEDDNDELLGMIMTVRNKVDGVYVTRPTFESPKKKWEVEYSIQTMSDERAKKLYTQVKRRRRGIMEDDRVERDKAWHVMFGSALPRLSRKGKEFREQEEERGRERPVWVVGEEGGKRWEEVFGKR